jgi:hypothetical protein
MISAQLKNDLAPLDYRYALDASMSVLAGAHRPAVLCNVDELLGEVRQRISGWFDGYGADAALWVEPLADTWQADLAALSQVLPTGSVLAIIASRPLARLLPERQSWSGQPLGIAPGGVGQLQRALTKAGFVVKRNYGFHSAFAIGLNLLSQPFERWRRPDLGDRLHYAARLCYCTRGLLAGMATVSLLLARKDRTDAGRA